MLLVDDSFDAAESVATLARVPGLELHWTLHADEGIRLARKLQPDVILLHRSPAAIGDRLVRRLREQGRPRQPVVVGLTSDDLSVARGRLRSHAVEATECQKLETTGGDLACWAPTRLRRAPLCLI
jgi:DNA-binding response OmpR family regulator